MPAKGQRKPINPKRVIELASKGLNLQEIAAFENVSHDTIQRYCASELEKGWELRNASLRRRQFEVAMEGAHEKERANPTMLIWLGKQYLGQADKSETNITGQFLHGHFDFSSLTADTIAELRRIAAQRLLAGDIR